MSGETTAPAFSGWFQRLLTPARTCAVVAALAAAVGIAVEFRREAAWSTTTSLPPTPHARESAVAESPSAARLHRPGYRHSVIVGGAFSREEVEGVAHEDAVVAAHYRGVNLTELRPATVREPRDVYVSYRIGHRVYWTKEPVRLAVGETLLTDGTNEIRARCGNRISDIPHAPVSDLEPIAEELDEQQDPRGDSSMTGERAPLASAPGALAYVPFLSLIQQPLVGDGLNGPSDAAIWPVPPALLVLGTADLSGNATVWGEPLVVIGGPTGRGSIAPTGGRSGGGSSGGGGSDGGSGGGSGGGAESGDSGPTDGDSTGPGSTGDSSQGGSSEGSTSGGGSGTGGSGAGGGAGSGSDGSGGPGSSGGSDGGSGGTGSTGGSSPGGEPGPGGGGGGTGTGGQLPTIYPGSEGVIVSTGDAPAVPEPGILALLGLGVAATVTRWARRPRR